MSARMFFGKGGDPLAVTATDIDASGTNVPPGNQSGTVSATSTATPTGGVPPYTYLWTIVTQSSGNISLNNTTLQTVGVQRIATPGTSTATIRVTVTDSVGATATDDISATMTLESGL